MIARCRRPDCAGIIPGLQHRLQALIPFISGSARSALGSSAGKSVPVLAFAWIPWYPDTCMWLDNNQPAGWDVVISVSLSLRPLQASVCAAAPGSYGTGGRSGPAGRRPVPEQPPARLEPAPAVAAAPQCAHHPGPAGGRSGGGHRILLPAGRLSCLAPAVQALAADLTALRCTGSISGRHDGHCDQEPRRHGPDGPERPACRCA